MSHKKHISRDGRISQLSPSQRANFDAILKGRVSAVSKWRVRDFNLNRAIDEALEIVSRRNSDEQDWWQVRKEVESTETTITGLCMCNGDESDARRHQEVACHVIRSRKRIRDE